MPQFTIDNAMQIARQHHEAGRLAEAEKIYRHILARQPDQPDALHRLGLVAHQVGRHDAALDLIRKAIAFNPADSAYHANLAEVYRCLGRLDEARAAALHAIELNPGLIAAYNNLGTILKSQGKLDEAAEAYSKAVELNGDYAPSHNNLGIVLSELGRSEQALAEFSRAVELSNDYAEAHCNRGNALRALRKPDEAISAYLAAILLNRNYAQAFSNMGNALRDLLRLDEALAAYSTAIQLKPRYPDAHYNQGIVLADLGRLDAAIAAYSRAVELKPQFAQALSNMGVVLKDQGMLDEALKCFDRAIALKPDDPVFGSNRLYTLHFHPDFNSREILQEHRGWNQRHAETLKNSSWNAALPRASAPDRRLRIGYVSADLSSHPVGRFLLPLLKHHNRGEFEIFCYASVRFPDRHTDLLRDCSDTWRNVIGLSDEEVARLVREDEIDILVDLSQHSAGSRLLVFARKPAPVQFTYLGYCSTTGLDTVDYRFTDPYFDPPELGEGFYSERSIRLPRTYWCYDPPAEAPEPGPLLAISQGRITFGCLNNFAKISAPALAAWCRLLGKVPRSRLVLHTKDGSHRQRVIDIFNREGIQPARVSFVAQLPLNEHLRLYQQIDIGLDPFPCAGGMTTCDALWMGVPVVSLAGQTAVSRAGLSILSNVGHPEWVARSDEPYVELAAELAGDVPRLSNLRGALREQMRQSPLMDAPRFARDMESAFRQAWRESVRDHAP